MPEPSHGQRPSVLSQRLLVEGEAPRGACREGVNALTLVGCLLFGLGLTSFWVPNIYITGRTRVHSSVPEPDGLAALRYSRPTAARTSGMAHRMLRGWPTSAHASFSMQARAAPSATDVEAVTVQESTPVETPSNYLPFKGVNPKLVPQAPVTLTNGVDTSDTTGHSELSQEELIELAKQFLNIFDIFGTGKEDPGAPTVRELLAPDFQFNAPVVGPLSRDAFLDAFSSFKLADAFPDGKPNYYNFHVDPFKPNRVFFMSHFIGTNTGSIAGALPATNKKVESPPQASSVSFNARGEITEFTIGYVLDKNIGNTGGLGGAYGIFYAIGYGLPFPEGQPWQPSPPYFFLTRGGPVLTQVLNTLRKTFGV